MTKKTRKSAGLFLANSLLLVALVGGGMMLLDVMVTRGLQRSEEFWHKEWNEIRSGKAKADVLVVGSSRAFRDVNPQDLKDSLGMAAYNLGADNLHMRDQLLRYQYYREHYPKPKVIVHVVDFFSFESRTSAYFPDQYLPYYGDSTIRKMVEMYNPIPWHDRLPGVRYVGNAKKAGIGFSEFLGLQHFTCGKQLGHEPLRMAWTDDFEGYKKAYPNGRDIVIDVELVRGFDDYLAECKREGIQVILVYAPEYYQIQGIISNRSTVFQIYRRLAAQHGFAFWDYSHDPICQSTAYFVNSQHLNAEGTKVFSSALAGRIRQEMQSR